MPPIAKRMFAFLMAVTLSAPAPLVCGAEPAAQGVDPAKPVAAAAQDLALSKEGLFEGQLLGAEGQPIAGGKVWLANAKLRPVAAVTDAQGRFAYRGLKRGVYCLQAGESLRVCRVWDHKAAPPKSLGALMIVADEAAVRGQSGPPPMLNTFVQRSKKFFSHPVGMVTLGAAIATPIVLSASDDDPPASP